MDNQGLLVSNDTYHFYMIVIGLLDSYTNSEEIRYDNFKSATSKNVSAFIIKQGTH